MPDNLRSSHEDKLISLSKQYQSAYVSKDLNKLDELFSPKVVYHADKVTLQSDITGRSNVLGYIKEYFASYDYERKVAFGAVDHNDLIAFTASVEKGVTPKKPDQGQKDKGEVKSSNVIVLTALFFDKSHLIQHIYVARQLSFDEAHRKLKKVPDYKGSSFNPEVLPNTDHEPTAERAQLHEEYAHLWNNMFCNNDVKIADKICDPKIKVHNLLTSDETDGLDSWKDSLAKIFKDWDCKGNRHYVAVTPGNKAFVWWETTGITKGEWTTVWGISVLVFNEDKIAESAAIYEPFPGMREALVNGA